MKLKESNVIAIDLDGTLADDSIISMQDYRPDLIGDPVPLMVNRVKELLRQGREVVIFTARVFPREGCIESDITENAIKAWCLKYIGRELPVTCQKDPMFCEIYDDKAIHVEKNTGRLIGVVDNFLAGDSIGDFFK